MPLNSVLPRTSACIAAARPLSTDVMMSTEQKGNPRIEIDPRWVAYYAEASKRRRARGWHRRHRDPVVRNPWDQRKLVVIFCALGFVAAVVVALVS